MTHEVALSIAREGEIEYHLMRYRDRKGQYWADIIDMLTMYPEARRQVVRLLAEIDARGSPRPDTSQSSFAMQRSSILGPERALRIGLQVQPPGWFCRTPTVHRHRDEVGPVLVVAEDHAPRARHCGDPSW
jgi:hypothetical protein